MIAAPLDFHAQKPASRRSLYGRAEKPENIIAAFAASSPAYAAQEARSQLRRAGSRLVAGDLPLKVEPLLAVMPARIQAVLKFALLIQIVERPVAEPDEDDDGDQGEEIAAPARVCRGRGICPAASSSAP